MEDRRHQWRRARNRALLVGALTLVTAAGYLLFWPVVVKPEAWHPPRRTSLEGVPTITIASASPPLLSLGTHCGPETIAMATDGSVVTGTACGAILAIDTTRAAPPRMLAQTGGRPLGIAVHSDGRLIIADAVRGLLAIDDDGAIHELVSTATILADGNAMGFPNSVAIGSDGAIYFTDATSRFPARVHGLDDAVFLDLIDQRGHGRVLRLDPDGHDPTILLGGLRFPNGIALATDGRSLLVAETGRYRVLRIAIDGDGPVAVDTVVDALPAFPDNISRGLDGRYWIGLVTPRSSLLDALAPQPFLRKTLARLPRWIRRAPASPGSAIAIDEDGRIVARVYDSTGRFSGITGILETPDGLFIGTLDATEIGRAAAPSNR